jgi:selenium donor protein
VLVGISTNDDAAVYDLGAGTALVATVDIFTPIVDDPRDFGRIAAANSLSDVYAMGARPLFALSIIGFPAKKLPLDVMAGILAGGAEKAAEAGIAIVGGHSIDDAEPKYGLSVTGVVDPAKVVRNSTARPGDALVLTKPIGTGVLSQGIKLEFTTPEEAQAAIASMAALNRAACDAMLAVGASAATDITGFGLVGHLHEMVHSSGVTAHLESTAIPLLPGARRLAELGVVPGGSKRNADYFGKWITWGKKVDPWLRTLLADAQTSGGLLIALPAAHAAKLVAELRARGVAGAVIGHIDEGNGETGRILID